MWTPQSGDNTADFTESFLCGLNKTMSVKTYLAHSRWSMGDQTMTWSRCWVLDYSSVTFFLTLFIEGFNSADWAPSTNWGCSGSWEHTDKSVILCQAFGEGRDGLVSPHLHRPCGDSRDTQVRCQPKLTGTLVGFWKPPAEKLLTVCRCSKRFSKISSRVKTSCDLDTE